MCLSRCAGWGDGDPHFNTLDSANYTFNGLGEYRSIRAQDSMTMTSIEAQVRTTLLPGTTATVFTAAAIGQFNQAGGECDFANYIISVYPRGWTAFEGVSI